MFKGSVGDDVLIARKFPNKQLQVSPANGYKGRFSFAGKVSGNVTFTIWFIKKNDERTFEFKVHLTSVVYPWIKNSVELIVVGKLYARNELSKKKNISFFFVIIVADVYCAIFHIVVSSTLRQRLKIP